MVLLAVGLVGVGIGLSLRKPTPPTPVPVTSATRSADPPDPFPNFWPDPPPHDVGALLDGLGPSSPLADGWRVRGISPVQDGRITIDVARGDVGFRVWIVRRDRDERLPPRRTKKYDLYTAQPRPTAEAVGDEAYASVVAALAARVQRTEDRVKVPAGM